MVRSVSENYRIIEGDKMTEYIQYDTKRYDFKSKVETYLECENLELIHEREKFQETLKHGTDQSQGLHRQFYSGMDLDLEFYDLYTSFIREVVYPRFNEKLIYQKFPTFRVHQPDNIAVFGWHRDRDYNHSPAEINYFMPITKAFGTNTIWHESKQGLEDYHPMEVDYGALVEWDGANCKHGNKENDTGKTRISFDFRVLSLDDYYKYPPKESITKGTKFEIGGYFELLEV